MFVKKIKKPQCTYVVGRRKKLMMFLCCSWKHLVKLCLSSVLTSLYSNFVLAVEVAPNIIKHIVLHVKHVGNCVMFWLKKSTDMPLPKCFDLLIILWNSLRLISFLQFEHISSDITKTGPSADSASFIKYKRISSSTGPCLSTYNNDCGYWWINVVPAVRCNQYFNSQSSFVASNLTQHNCNMRTNND